ncbi:MAG TPA: hypothetical protein VK667_02975, partial [Ktedonobacteraceae bacterium]|nr:hypothetical protein [Ktedonobacteraceae bacterium]
FLADRAAGKRRDWLLVPAKDDKRWGKPLSSRFSWHHHPATPKVYTHTVKDGAGLNEAYELNASKQMMRRRPHSFDFSHRLTSAHRIRNEMHISTAKTRIFSNN